VFPLLKNKRSGFKRGFKKYSVLVFKHKLFLKVNVLADKKNQKRR